MEKSGKVREFDEDWKVATLHDTVIADVDAVLLMNVVQRQIAANPRNKPTDLGCESAFRLISFVPTVAFCHSYSALKLILILPYCPTEGRRLS